MNDNSGRHVRQPKKRKAHLSNSSSNLEVRYWLHANKKSFKEGPVSITLWTNSLCVDADTNAIMVCI